MPITFQSVLEHGLESTASIITAGFADYFVPINITVAGLLSMVRQESVDLNLSRVMLQEYEPVGIALIARRGWTSRLAAMSIVPQARSKGIGAQCVHQLLDDARHRGDQAMNLEVVEQNAPAVRLYEKCGFQKMRRLVGFTGQPKISDTNLALEQIDVHEVARVLITHGTDDLPWQLSGESLVTNGPPNIAYRAGASYIALSNPDAPMIVVRAIVTLPDARRQGHATQLLRTVMARHPEKTWRVSATFPEELSGLFEKIGMVRDALSQWQMQIHLATN